MNVLCSEYVYFIFIADIEMKVPQTSHSNLSEAMKRLERQLVHARSDKTRQQSMYREIIQRLAKENRGLRKSLQAANEKCEETSAQLFVKDRVIRELQLELEASKVLCLIARFELVLNPSVD